MSRRAEALFVALGAVVVYALTRSGNHSETEDSVAFAVRVRDAPAADLLEGTHLVYLLVGRAFARIASATRFTSDPLLALQTLDMLLAGAAVGGLWLLLRRAGFGRSAAALTCGMAAFSYAFWRNAVEAEVYAFSAAALVGCFAAACVAARTGGARAFTVLGLANGAAVLAHVTNVLFAVVAGAALWLVAGSRRTGRRDVPRWAAAYAVGGSLVVVPAYALAAVVHRLASPAEFWRWFTERSGQAGDFGTIGLSNLAQGTFGSARALVGGHFALLLDPVREFLTTRFAGKTFSEEVFLLEGFPDVLALGLLALAFVAALLFAALAGQWLRRPALDPGRRTLVVLAAAWLVPYALICLWWDPLNIELWYGVWLPAAVLIGAAVDTLPGERARRILVVSTIGSIFIVNLLGSVWPQRDETGDLWRAKAEWYRANTRSDDLVVSNGYVWSSYLRYLLDADVVDIEDAFREAETEREALGEIRRRVASAGGRVLVSGEAFHAFADRREACLDAPRTCASAAATARELQGECDRIATVARPFERVWRCFQSRP